MKVMEQGIDEFDGIGGSNIVVGVDMILVEKKQNGKD